MFEILVRILEYAICSSQAVSLGNENMSAPSKVHFLTLPLEIRLRVYRFYIDKCEMFLEHNEDFTVGNSESLTFLWFGKRLSRELVGSMDFSLGFVCHQTIEELLPFFAANTKLNLDSNAVERVGLIHTLQLSFWLKSMIQEVVFWDTEVDRACLVALPSLKRVKVYVSDYEDLPIPEDALRWSKTDVEKQAVMKGVETLAIGAFAVERETLERTVVDRAFCLKFVIEFGMFTADFPDRDAMTGGTLVSFFG